MTTPPTPPPVEPPKEPKTALGGGEPPKVPEPELSPEAKAKAELFGAPEKDYAPYTLPDGYTPDEHLTKDFNALAKELGLSQKGAQRLVDAYNANLQRSTEKFVADVTKWGTEAAADAEYGGVNYEANLTQYAHRAIAEYGSPALIELLNSSGMGNHPEVIRFAFKVGKAMGEGTVKGGETPGGEKKLPPHEVLYGKNPA